MNCWETIDNAHRRYSSQQFASNMNYDLEFQLAETRPNASRERGRVKNKNKENVNGISGELKRALNWNSR